MRFILLFLLPAIAYGQCIIISDQFENHSCCPTTPTTPPAVMTCINWMQTTNATTDYWHPCGNVPQSLRFLITDGVIATMIYNSGVTQWKEYFSRCINLNAGQNYTVILRVSYVAITVGARDTCDFPLTPLTVTVYGNSSCVSSPLSTTGCPSWTVLGTTIYNGIPSWSDIFISFTPAFDVRTIAIGAGCSINYASDGSCRPYFLWTSIIIETDCDDGKRCTDDNCVLGVCSHVPDTTCCLCQE